MAGEHLDHPSSSCFRIEWS